MMRAALSVFSNTSSASYVITTFVRKLFATYGPMPQEPYRINERRGQQHGALCTRRNCQQRPILAAMAVRFASLPPPAAGVQVHWSCEPRLASRPEGVRQLQRGVHAGIPAAR